MSVKEIRELDDEIKEVGVSNSRESGDDESWEERDFVDDDEALEDEEKDEEFSIGDTMLARGDSVSNWGLKNLEEEVEEFEDGEFFDPDAFDFEEEGFGGEGFSYEVASSGLGDMYGVASSGLGDMYGTSSGIDLYGASGGKGSDSVNMYNTSSAGGSESSLYNTGVGGGKKNMMGVSYKVEGGSKKKKVRRGGRSGLEGGVVGVKRRRSKGLSMI